MSRYNKSPSKLPIILILVSIIALVIYLPRLELLTKKESFSRKDIESIVKETIEKSPESIISSLEKYQNNKNNEAIEKLKKAVIEKKDQLEDKNSPSNNKQDFDITIIEFFDYNCGYCKRASHALNQAINQDQKIKIIYKEFPILGDNSLEAAQIALAVNIISPEKYINFHDKLMNSKNLDKTIIDNIVLEFAIDKAELEKVKNSSSVLGEISANKDLARALGINGTPAFIINGDLISGAIDYQGFMNYINKIRSKEDK